jgi:hypothetical protein
MAEEADGYKELKLLKAEESPEDPYPEDPYEDG